MQIPGDLSETRSTRCTKEVLRKIVVRAKNTEKNLQKTATLIDQLRSDRKSIDETCFSRRSFLWLRGFERGNLRIGLYILVVQKLLQSIHVLRVCIYWKLAKIMQRNQEFSQFF